MKQKSRFKCRSICLLFIVIITYYGITALVLLIIGSFAWTFSAFSTSSFKYLPWKCVPALTKLLFSFVLSSPKKFGRYAYGCIELFNGQKPYRRVVCLSGASINWMIMSSLFAYSSSFASIKKKVLLYGAQCDKGSWQFTPPIVGFRCWQACRLCSHFVYAHGVGT